MKRQGAQRNICSIPLIAIITILILVTSCSDIPFVGDVPASKTYRIYQIVIDTCGHKPLLDPDWKSNCKEKLAADQIDVKQVDNLIDCTYTDFTDNERDGCLLSWEELPGVKTWVEAEETAAIEATVVEATRFKETTLTLSQVSTGYSDCTRDFNGILQSDGSYAVDPDGNYIAGEVLVHCVLEINFTAEYETSYDPGYILCQYAGTADYSPGGRNREPRPVTGSGEVKLSLYLVDFEKFQDYNGDYEPDNLPGPDEGWYPPISCTLTDDRNGVVVGSPNEVRCYTPGSISPMPPDVCIMAKARTAEMIAVVPYDIVENTPTPTPTTN